MTSNFLNELATFLNQGWVGALIGLFSLLLALYLFRSSQIFPRLAIQMNNTRLMGGRDAELTDNVTIYYQKDLSQSTKTEVSQLTKTTIVIWNAGKTTFRGKDIVSSDLFRFEFEPNSQILDSKITQMTRVSNLFTINEDSLESHIAICAFDFLDPQDGVRIEILHTSDDRPIIYGTIRGLPQGLTNWGSLPGRDRRIISITSRSGRKIPIKTSSFMIALSILITSIGLVVSGLFPDLFIFLVPSLGKITQQEALLVSGNVKWPYILTGVLYGVTASFFLLSERRRFPKDLAE
jgi:hypothetical protein